MSMSVRTGVLEQVFVARDRRGGPAAGLRSGRTTRGERPADRELIAQQHHAQDNVPSTGVRVDVAPSVTPVVNESPRTVGLAEPRD